MVTTSAFSLQIFISNYIYSVPIVYDLAKLLSIEDNNILTSKFFRSNCNSFINSHISCEGEVEIDRSHNYSAVSKIIFVKEVKKKKTNEPDW